MRNFPDKRRKNQNTFDITHH